MPYRPYFGQLHSTNGEETTDLWAFMVLGDTLHMKWQFGGLQDGQHLGHTSTPVPGELDCMRAQGIG